MPVESQRLVRKEATVVDHGLRSSGMRDLGPEEMRRFRRVERVFLDVVGALGYREIRTPTIEPLHLYTASGALSPGALDRVYSFLDWDGWSGERVVLRPDATVAAARWFLEQANGDGPQRLCYVEPSYRFQPGSADREVWQCGVEIFDLPADEADRELILLARDLLRALGLTDLSVDLAHAGLARQMLAAAGLTRQEQLSAFDRMLEGDVSVAEELIDARPEGSSALRLLADVDGSSVGYIANLRASTLPIAPGAAAALDELEAVAQVLDSVALPYRVLAGTASNFEYYTGVTFRLRAGDAECVTGGRYDGLVETIGGRPAAASGFAANLLRLATLSAVSAGEEAAP